MQCEGATYSVVRERRVLPASPVRSRVSGGCCCRGTRADTSGRTSILGLFPCWAATASRSCSGLGGRRHSADDGFILRRVAWLSQAKTRPEARPARTYSGAAQTGGWTFHRIAPAWGAAATCDMMAGGRQRLQTTAAADDGGGQRGGPQTTASSPPPPPPPLLIAHRVAEQPTPHIKSICNGYLFRGNPRGDPYHMRRKRRRTTAVEDSGGGIYEIESTTVIICC